MCYRRPTCSRFSWPVRASSTAAYWPVRPMRARAPLGLLEDVDPVDLGATGVGQEQRREDADGSGLAGSVWSENPEDLAPLDVEVDAAERLGVSEALGQSLSDYGGHRK
jgi:hypothetical protein